MKCGSGYQCMARDAIDCGGGASCPAGKICIKGGAECLTSREIAERKSLELLLKKEAAAQKKEDTEAEAWLKSEQARLVQQAAIQRAQQANARATAQQKQIATTAQTPSQQQTGQQNSPTYTYNPNFGTKSPEITIAAPPGTGQTSKPPQVNPPTTSPSGAQAPTSQQNTTITTIIPGNGQGASSSPAVSSAPATKPAASGQTPTIVTIAPGSNQAAGAPPSATSSNAAVPGSTTIATIIPANKANPSGGPVTGANTAPSGAKTDTTIAGPLIVESGNNAYTYTIMPSGNVQITANGKVIATTSPQVAAQQYGYHLPNPPIQSNDTAPVAHAASSQTPSAQAANGAQTVSTSAASMASPTAPLTPAEMQNLKNNIGSLIPTTQNTQNSSPPSANQATSYNTQVTGFTASQSSPGAPQASGGPPSLSLNVSAAQSTAQLGGVNASISFGNLNAGLTASTGPLPLSANITAGASASVLQGQLTNSSTGTTLTANAGYVEGTASASVSPIGASVSFGGGAYAVEGKAAQQIVIGNYDVNLSAEGGIGVSAQMSASVGIADIGGTINAGPVGFGINVSRD